MRRTRRIGSVLISALLLSIDATAEPMNLDDPTPRIIEVAFEVSPREKPTQTDTVYSPKLFAYFEPAESPGRIRVTIDHRDVEGVLFADHHPVPGSVTDFVWIFDAISGEVLSAEVKGRIVKELDWGLWNSTAEVYVELNMETRRVGGVEEPKRWFGQTLFGYCDDPATRSCEIVSGRSYDRESGYVYAVGPMQVHFGKLKLPTFSPLGEAIFSEADADRLGTDVAGFVEQRRTAPFRNALAVAASRGNSALPAVAAGPPAR